MAYISDTEMTSESTRVRCTFDPDAAGAGRAGWRCHGLRPLAGRLLTRNAAITAITLAERLAAGFGDDDVFVAAWRDELGIDRGNGRASGAMRS